MKTQECRDLLNKYDIDESLLDFSYAGILELKITDSITLYFAPYGYEEGMSGFTVSDWDGTVYQEVSWDNITKAQAFETIAPLEKCLNGLIDFNNIEDTSLVDKIIRLVSESVRD